MTTRISFMEKYVLIEMINATNSSLKTAVYVEAKFLNYQYARGDRQLPDFHVVFHLASVYLSSNVLLRTADADCLVIFPSVIENVTWSSVTTKKYVTTYFCQPVSLPYWRNSV